MPITALTGWLVVLQLAIATLSGLVLSFHYIPVPSLAYLSIVDMETADSLGRALRASHFLSAHASLFLTLVHFTLLVLRKASSLWENRAWTSGFIALFLLVPIAYGGRILPWDHHGGVSLVIAETFLGFHRETGLGSSTAATSHTLQRLLVIHGLGTALLAIPLVYHIRFKNVLAPSKDSPLEARPLAIACAVFLLTLFAALWVRTPLDAPFREPLTDVRIGAEWYLRWIQAIAVRSLRLAWIVLGGLGALVVISPRIHRRYGGRIAEFLWLGVGTLLILLTLLPTN